MRGRRKTVKISDAEWAVMKVMWDGCENKSGMTLGEIVRLVNEENDWGNTTIRTLLMRLVDKGAVEVDKSIGVYKYSPKTSRSECESSALDSFIERVFDNSSYNLMATLVRDGKLSAKEKKDIIDILNEMDE